MLSLNSHANSSAVVFSVIVLGMIHTGSESPQDGLRDIWTCGMTLASTYVLCCLSAMWLQFQKIGKKSKIGVSTDLVYRC